MKKLFLFSSLLMICASSISRCFCVVKKDNSLNVKRALSTSVVIPDTAKSLGVGSASFSMPLMGYNVSFSYKDDTNVLRIMNKRLYFQPFLTFDYSFKYSSKSFGVYLHLENIKLVINYFSIYVGMGDSGSVPSFVNMSYAFSRSMTINAALSSIDFKLNQFNYEENRFNSLPSYFALQYSCDGYSFPKARNGAFVINPFNFKLVTTYYDSALNTEVNYSSETYYPFDINTFYTNDRVLFYGSINDYDLTSSSAINQFSLMAFNSNVGYVPGDFGYFVPLLDVVGINNIGYDKGYIDGVNETIANGGGSSGVFNIIGSAFNSVTSFLNINVFGSITIGTLLLIPLTFGILLLIIKMLGA